MGKEIYVFKIDENGFIIGDDVVDSDNIQKDEISEPIPIHVIYKAKWVDGQWIEGESQEEKEEREAQQALDSLNSTLKELLKAERDLETIELLLEMGVI